MNLQGKVAIVTGGSRGIGGACSKLLASRGAKVVVTYLNNAERAESLVTEIRNKGGEALAIQADVRETGQTNLLVEKVVQTYKHIDIVVSSAPAGWVEKSFMEINWEEYRNVIEGELKAAYDITKAVIPIMIAQHYGRLVYMVSGLARHPISGAIASGTAKAAIVAFVKYIAYELGVNGITANAVAPAIVETEINQFMPEIEKTQIAEMTPLHRIAIPEDIAGIVAFLASDDSKFLTGSYIPVTGGLEMD